MNGKLLDFKKQNQEYAHELKRWLDVLLEKAWTREDLCRFSVYFLFRNRLRTKQMVGSTFTRTQQRIPANEPGKYNLYVVLGIYFAFDVITREDMEAFLGRHRIEPPNGYTWPELWAIIEAGAQETRRALSTVSTGAKGHDNPKVIIETLQHEQQVTAPSPVVVARSVNKLSRLSRPGSLIPAGRTKILVVVVLMLLVAVPGFSFIASRQNNTQSVPMAATQTASQPANKARFGVVTNVEPGPTCADSIINIEVFLSANTKDFDTSDVIGFVAIDGNEVVVMARLIYFWTPGVYNQPLSVNLRHLSPITARPITIRLYDTGYNPAFKVDTSSMEVYDFIVKTGTLLAETTIDPAEVLPDCIDFPLKRTPSLGITTPSVTTGT